MATKEPILPGNYYHLYNHSNGNFQLFKNDGNYQFFLNKYAKYVVPYVNTLAYCLMPNHFHFLIMVKENITSDTSELSEILPNQVTNAIKNWLISYTQSYHKVFGTKGNLYYQKIRRKLINDEKYLNNLISYIHLNPVIHGFVGLPEEWQYSSYNAIISDKPTLVERQEVIDLFDDAQNFQFCHNLKVLNYLLEKIDTDF